jgi:hypothetical protein
MTAYVPASIVPLQACFCLAHKPRVDGGLYLCFTWRLRVGWATAPLAYYVDGFIRRPLCDVMERAASDSAIREPTGREFQNRTCT